MSKRKNDVVEVVCLRKSSRQENLLKIKKDNIQVDINTINKNLTHNNNDSILSPRKKTIKKEVTDTMKKDILKSNFKPSSKVIVKNKIDKENIPRSTRNSKRCNILQIPRDITILKKKNVKEETRSESDVILKKRNIKSEMSSSSLVTKKAKKIKDIESSKKHNLEIPVDKECTSKLGSVIVFVEGNDIYDVMLNQTNLQFNNNKFYVIQLLKEKKSENYSVWMRWARVGRVGQTKLTNFGKNLKAAKECFCKKFSDKTKNYWENRSDFEKVNGKYDLVHIDYLKCENLEESEGKKENKIKLETVECKLDEKIQDLLKIIFDIKEMNSTASGMNYDSNRIPLGRLTETQIKAGYKALREIEGLLNEGYTGSDKLIKACNAYYTRIPHDFGMRVPPIIRSLVDIQRELELLETLSDIKIALSLLKMGDNNIHPLERQYQSLDCFIKPIHPQEDNYQLINDYLLTTHGDTHKDYSLEMLELYDIRKENEWANFEDLGNKMLLWHGSRTTNYGGILSQGLRIAPAEAPITGHMFGKGVYFSDISSKSANYIYSSRSKNVGFLLLCEVSLGTCNSLTKANNRASRLPKSTHSVKGCGTMEPEPSTWVTMPDNVVVPVGSPRDSKLSEREKGYLLNYNEYIVYNRNQIKMRYLLKVRFNYK